MLLLIDAGNTRIKWALADMGPTIATDAAAGPGNRMPGTWVASGALGHDGIEALADAWQLPVDAVLVSNVAGAAMQATLSAQLQRLQQRCAAPLAIEWFASTANVAGVRNGYRNPQQLGCDRLASLIGARALLPDQALIVATCGTATTVDALTAAGEFIGGMILPGLGTMAASLARRTAQLPQVAPRPPAAGGAGTFADNTDDAIYSGCLAAQAGAIGRAVAEHGDAHCLLSGGAAAWIAPWLQVETTLVENLVLTGLHSVALARPLAAASANHHGSLHPC